MVNTANTVVTEAVKYYFTGSDLPIAPALLGIKSSCNAQCIHDAVDAWMAHVPEDYDALWMVSSQWIYAQCAFTRLLECVYGITFVNCCVKYVLFSLCMLISCQTVFECFNHRDTNIKFLEAIP